MSYMSCLLYWHNNNLTYYLVKEIEKKLRSLRAQYTREKKKTKKDLQELVLMCTNPNGFSSNVSSFLTSTSHPKLPNLI